MSGSVFIGDKDSSENEIIDGNVLLARELSKIAQAENYEDSFQGVTDKIKEDLFGVDKDADMSDEDYEWIYGHPNYWKRANPFSKENFENINKILTESDPNVIMGKILSEQVQKDAPQ